VRNFIAFAYRAGVGLPNGWCQPAKLSRDILRDLKLSQRDGRIQLSSQVEMLQETASNENKLDRPRTPS
jgi:hypothetical protein